VLLKGLTVSPLEASGLSFLDGTGLFAVVSDETDGKQPELFLMDTTGHIVRTTMVKNVPAINDMEGITRDPWGRMYLCASQSHNRKGILSEARKLLVRASLDGISFTADARVLLVDLLAAAAGETPEEDWCRFVNKALAEKTADIEGVLWFDGKLLLGFKNPRMGKDAVILGIDDPDMMFSGNALKAGQVSLWRHITLFDTATGTFCGISDLCSRNGRIYGLSTGVHTQSGVDEDVGLFWTFDPEAGGVQVLRHFSGLKPEGIAGFGTGGEFCIVFDNGSKNSSQFMIVKVPL
jgi:hypothetical protein